MKAYIEDKWRKATNNIKALPIDNAIITDAKAYGRGVPTDKSIPLPVIHYIIYEIDNTFYSYILDFGILIESNEKSLDRVTELTVNKMVEHVKACIDQDNVDKLFENAVWHDSTAWGHYGFLRHQSEIARLKKILYDQPKELILQKISYEGQLNYAA